MAIDESDHNPKVFVSYASEDKDHFVIPFATYLRNQGIKAWVAEWEVKPGDSLVDRIFEDGLKGADAMIVVLSTHSVDKPWVREELNAGMVNRIEKAMKLIPVLLDDSEIPPCLQQIVRVDIPNSASPDDALKSIVDSIFGLYDRPQLGAVPERASSKALAIQGLDRIDSLFLGEACSLAIETKDSLIDGEGEFADRLIAKDLSKQQIMDSQEILANKGYVRMDRLIGPPQVYPFIITTGGFEEFFLAKVKGYARIQDVVARSVVLDHRQSAREIAAEHDTEEMLVAHVLTLLNDRELLGISRNKGPIQVSWWRPNSADSSKFPAPSQSRSAGLAKTCGLIPGYGR